MKDCCDNCKEGNECCSVHEGKFSSIPTKQLVRKYKQMSDERLSGSAALTFRLIAKELIKRKAKLESVNERWNPNKIKSHSAKAINFLKQAQQFAKQGQKGAVWNRLKDAGWELKQVMAFTESINEGKVEPKVKSQLNVLAKRLTDLKRADTQLEKSMWEAIMEYTKIYNMVKDGKYFETAGFKQLPGSLELNHKRFSQKFSKSLDSIIKSTKDSVKRLKLKESVNEAKIYSDDWNLTKRVTLNFIKQNLKPVEKAIRNKDGEGLRYHLNQIISGIQNAKRALKLESINEAWSKGLERYKVTLENGEAIDVKVKKGKGLEGLEELLGKEGLKFEKITKKASRPTLTADPVNEAVEPKGNMAKIAKVVKDKQATKLSGVMIDMQSANLLMKLWDAVSDKDKEKMNKMNAKLLTNIIKKLWSRVNLKLPI